MPRCVQLDNPITKEREFAGLMEAMEDYQLRVGYLLTEDTNGQEYIDVNGETCIIHIIPIWQWLLSENGGQALDPVSP